MVTHNESSGTDALCVGGAEVCEGVIVEGERKSGEQAIGMGRVEGKLRGDSCKGNLNSATCRIGCGESCLC